MQWTARVAIALVLVAGASCATVSEEQRRQAESHRDLGSLYLDRGEPELAIREFRLALKSFEADPESNFAIGEAYRRKQEYALAEQHLRRALALDPELHDARLNLGALYLEQERWDDAIRENQVLAREPTFLNPARALVNLGWAHYKSGRPEQAESYFRQAISENASNYHAQMNLGISLYDRGEVAEAMEHFQRVLEILVGRPPELFGNAEAQARFRLAMAYVRLGERARAVEHLQVAAKQGGESQWGQKSREYLAVLE